MKKLFVIFAVIGMVGMFAATTMAADWSFYGSARMQTWWVTEDKKGDEEGDLTWAEQGNSRFGARVKVSDTLSGRYEVGVGSGSMSQRLLYGTWDFGAGSMVVGQAYGPANIFISNKVFDSDGNNLNFGGLYTGRVEQITFNFAKIFKIGLVKPVTALADGAAADINDDLDVQADDSGFDDLNVDTSLPKLEMALVYGQESWWVQGSFGYQSITAKDSQTIDDDGGEYDGWTVDVDQDIDSMIYGVGGMFNMAGFYVGGVVMGGTNIGAYGAWAKTGDSDYGPIPELVSSVGAGSVEITDIEDTTSVGFNFVLGYTINDMLTVEGGYGWIESDNDTWAEKDAAQAYYINLPITLAPGVVITPEFGVEDDMKDNADEDEGSDTYFGAKWQINF